MKLNQLKMRRRKESFANKGKAQRSIVSSMAFLVALSMPLGLSIVTNQEVAKSISSPYARCNAVKIIAHRGAVNKAHTENTLNAFDLAVSRGAPMVETDLRLSKDRRWVLMHDSNLNRTTNGTGEVGKRSLAYIKKLRTNDREKGGVPTIQDMISRYKTNPELMFDLEIKEKNPRKSDLVNLTNYLKKQGIKDRVIFTSFSGKSVSTIRSIDSSWQTALITGKSISPAKAASYGNTVVVHQKLVNKKFVDGMRGAGVAVYPWGVDTETVWKRVISSGVDGIITDHVLVSKRTCAVETNRP